MKIYFPQINQIIELEVYLNVPEKWLNWIFENHLSLSFGLIDIIRFRIHFPDR